jgi:hypothetical protein
MIALLFADSCRFWFQSGAQLDGFHPSHNALKYFIYNYESSAMEKQILSGVIELFLHGISLLVVLSISVRSVRKIFVIVC